MKLEEYVKKRKLEDGINEFDEKKTAENMQICVGYIFEFFNTYLKTAEADERTVLHNQKVEKYRNHIKYYSDDIQNWLLHLYSLHHKYVHVHLRNLIPERYFLLYDTEAEFRALSYEIYSEVIKPLPFLEGDSEMIYNFVKDTYRARSIMHEEDEFPNITPEINKWMEDTYREYNVNLYSYCGRWVFGFVFDIKLWPKGHRKKGQFYDYWIEYVKDKKMSIDDLTLWEYDYKQKDNLFAIDDLYQRMPKKPFTKGKKQFFETIMLYYYIFDFGAKDEEYWNEYIKTVYGSAE